MEESDSRWTGRCCCNVCYSGGSVRADDEDAYPPLLFLISLLRPVVRHQDAGLWVIVRQAVQRSADVHFACMYYFRFGPNNKLIYLTVLSALLKPDAAFYSTGQ